MKNKGYRTFVLYAVQLLGSFYAQSRAPCTTKEDTAPTQRDSTAVGFDAYVPTPFCSSALPCFRFPAPYTGSLLFVTSAVTDYPVQKNGPTDVRGALSQPLRGPPSTQRCRFQLQFARQRRRRTLPAHPLPHLPTRPPAPAPHRVKPAGSVPYGRYSISQSFCCSDGVFRHCDASMSLNSQRMVAKLALRLAWGSRGRRFVARSRPSSPPTEIAA